MATPKKQLQTLTENELLKENLNILKKIGEISEKMTKAKGEYSLSVRKALQNLSKAKDFEEQINGTLDASNKIKKRMGFFDKLEIGHLAGIITARRLLNDTEAERLEKEIKKIGVAKKRLVDIQKELDILREQTRILQSQKNLVTELSRKSELSQALGLDKYTQSVSSFFNKIAILQGKKVAQANKLLGFFNKWYISLVVSYNILQKIFEIFKELDNAVWESRKAFGMMRDDHKVLRDQAEAIFKEYAHLGVTVESVYKTQKAISLELGSAHSSTKGIVEQASLMSVQFGISEETTVKMLKNMGQMFKTTAESQIKMVGFTRTLANAAGVPLPEVMDDIAKASETTRMMFARTPLDMIKAAVEARRLGTTLDKMSASSRKLLNFTESIEAEMEASVLTGRSIDFQLARELSMKNKVLEANQEILRLSKQHNFENMDVLQAEKFALAAGKSADEIRSMIQAQRERLAVEKEAEKLAKVNDFRLKKRLDDTKRMMDANKSTAEEMGKNADIISKTNQNQALLTSISLSWKKIMVDIANIFLPTINGVLKVIVDLMNNDMVKGTIKWVTLLVGVVAPLYAIGKAIMFMWSKTKGFFKPLAKLRPLFSNFASFIGTILSKSIGLISKLGSLFLRFGTWIGNLLSPVQKIISAFSLGFIAGQQLLKLFPSLGDNAWIQSLMGGLIQLSDALIQPFKIAWDWIINKLGFGAHSPSKLGLAIYEGIRAVGNMIFDSITAPFRRAWDWISKLFGGGSRKIQPSIEKPALLSKNSVHDGVSMDKLLTNKEIKSYNELDKTDNAEGKTNESTKQKTTSAMDIQSLILSELKSLNENLMSGRIAVNMDGQLVSTNMNRGNKFRGNFGAISG